jgi:hypothetical protein
MILRNDLYETEPRTIEELIMCFPFTEFSMKRINATVILRVKRKDAEVRRLFRYEQDMFTVLYEMAKEINA